MQQKEATQKTNKFPDKQQMQVDWIPFRGGHSQKPFSSIQSDVTIPLMKKQC